MDALDEQCWAAAFPWLTKTKRSGQLQRLLESAELAYRSSALQLRALGKASEAQEMDIYASNVRLDLEQPELARWLYGATQGIRQAPNRQAMLESAMAGALSLLAADRGNIQLIDPATGALTMAVQ